MSNTGQTGPNLNLPGPVTLPPGYGPQEMAPLIRDIAVALESVPTILAKHHLTAAQYAELQKNAYFNETLKTFVTEWNKPKSTQERLTLQAAMALEDVLPNLAARAGNRQEDLSAAVETAKLFARIAGVGEAKVNPAATERFAITIDMGADTRLQVDKTRPVITLEAETPSDSTKNSIV